MGTLFVALSGGEPLLHPDFFDIAKEAQSAHFAVSVLTNATLIDEEKASKLKALSVFLVYVSLYGANAKTHDAITKTPGSFEKTTKAIRLLAEAGVRVGVKMPVMKRNFREHRAVQALVETLGASFAQIYSPYLYPPNGDETALEQFALDEAEMKAFVETVGIEKFEPKCDIIESRNPDNRLCGAGLDSLAIDFLGNVYPCPLFNRPAGNLKETPLEEIWANAPMLQGLRALRLADLPECAKCDLLNYCGRCTAAVHNKTGDFTGVDRLSCKIAKVCYNVVARGK